MTNVFPGKRMSLMMVLLITNAVHAQNADSLRLACLQYPKEDTAKVTQLTELCRIYRNIDLDTALYFGRKAVSLSEKLQFRAGNAQAWNRLGLVYKDFGQLDSALHCFRVSVLSFQSTGDRWREANGYNNIGLTWDEKSNQHNATQSYNKALAIFRSLGDQAEIAYTLTNMAQSERLHGNYVKAIDLYVKALEKYESDELVHTHGAEIGDIYSGMATVYVKMEKYDQAVSLYQKGLQSDMEHGRNYSIAVSQANLGRVYRKLGQFSLSEEFTLQALNYFRTVKYAKGIGSATLDLAELHSEMGDQGKAEHYYRESLELARTLGFSEGEGAALIGIADVYRKRGNIEEGLQLARQALQIASENNLPEVLHDVNYVMAEAYVTKGDFRNGYHHYEAYITLRDSIFNKEKLGRLHAIEKEYEVSRKQAQIDMLAQQNRINELSLQQERYIRYALVAILIFAFLIAGAIYAGFREKARLARKLTAGNDEIQRLNQVLEIRALRSQMDSHFVFNALNGLQHFFTAHPPENSIQYLGRVARLIRLTLQNASRDWVKLSEELDMLKLYLQVEQYRFPGKFDFDFIVDASAEHEKVPFLIMQPYVENAVLHGLIPRAGAGGKLTIRVEKTDARMQIIIEDNGVGRQSSAKPDPMFISMGSALARERLLKLSMQLGMLMEASIEDMKDELGQPCGTRSILAFGLQQDIRSIAA